MESIFENCVTEFDLNLFDQTSNVNQATPLTLCPVSRKLGIARIKDRLKGVSQVVHKAKNTNEILLEVQKELNDTKQELEETRNLLFEKNEEHKVICDERSTYFNQVTKYSIEIQKLKEKEKHYEKLDDEIEARNQVISGYSDQMKGLKTDMENLKEVSKQMERDASFALKQARASKSLVERRLVRLLKQYIVPQIKKRDKWLESTIKKYLPDASKAGESNQDKEDEMRIDDDEDDEELSTPPVLNRNTSLDFDCVGSVDTGRGSSLAFSDGEKSFHSPDYYMNCSPPFTVSIICNKCSLPKSDDSNNMKSPGRCGNDLNSDANVCKCLSISKKDISTSTTQIQITDAATQTSDISIEINSHKNVTTNLEENNSNIDQAHLVKSNVITMIVTPVKEENKSDGTEISSKFTDDSNRKSLTSPKGLRDFTFDSDGDDDIISVGSRVASPADEFNTSPVHSDQVVTVSQIIRNDSVLAAANSCDKNRLDTDNSDKDLENVIRNQSHVRQSSVSPPHVVLPASVIQSKKELLSTSLKLQKDMVSDSDDDEVMNNVSLTRKSHLFSPVDFDNTATTCTESPMTSNNLGQKITECLNVNNSKNCSDDVEIDGEIQTILDKMRLRLPIITPMPTTPQRRKIRSPELPTANQNTIIGQQAQVIAETINEQLNLLRVKVQEVFAPFVETIPQCLEQIPRLFSHGDLNEQFLRNLLPDSKNNSFHGNTLNLPSYAHEVSNNRRQPDVVDLNTGSMFCITGTDDIEGSNWNNHTIIEDESESEGLIINFENSDITDVVENGTICNMNKELRHVVHNNAISSGSLFKAKQSCVVGDLNVKVGTNSDRMKERGTHSNTQHPIDGNIVCNNSGRDLECDDNTCDVEGDDSTQASAVHSGTAEMPSLLTSRNSIVYESKEISDDDSDIPISELRQNLDNSVVSHDEICAAEILRKRKMRKLTKMETLRLKLLPKNKIKSDFTKSVRKLRPKPIPIYTVPKKKVKESDTAASLNEKSVYENAVKVVAALRLAKEPRIIVEDCVNYPQRQRNSETDDVKTDKESNDAGESSPKTTNNIKNKRLSENSRHVPENHILGSKESSSMNNTNNVNKTDISSNKNICNKSPQNLKEKKNDVSQKRSCTRSNSDVETISTKRADTSELTSEIKRKRMSESIRQTPNKHSKSNDSTALSPPRMLRSSSHLKHSKETGFEETSYAGHREGLRSKVNQNNSERQDNSSIISLGRKPRIARQNTRRSSENTQAELSLTVPETSKKISANTVSNADALFKNVGSHNQTTDQDKLVTDGNTTPRKSRIAKHNTSLSPEPAQIVQYSSRTHDTLKTNKTTAAFDANLNSNENNQVQSDQNSLDTNDNASNMILGRKCRIPRQNKSRSSETMPVDTDKKNYPNAVSYADLNLFNDDSQDQDEDQNKLDRDDSIISMRRRSRQNTTRSSETTKVEVHTAPETPKNNASVVSYEDLNLFSDEGTQHEKTDSIYRKDSLLCRMIERYGVQKIKHVAKQAPESQVTEICKRLENSLTEIVEAPHECHLGAMKRLVAEIRTWNVKHFIVGFIKFLKDPERKIELFNKSICPPFPPMTKKEQILLYVFDELQKSYEYRNIVQKILINIEYTLLALNKTETFAVIETMSHFYALLCRSYQKISQLRLFIVDAMYCLQMKSVVLIQQCLEVWMFVLPLGHMGLAKCPLVTCLVYLLHFYKCDDRFNRVQELRNTLRYKYNYDVTDWNENKILEMFRTAIVEIRDSSLERKTLRLSLLILAKRQGAKWCHNNIVQHMLRPIISDGATSATAKYFCVSLLGPLMKPYPLNMKVHFEMLIDYLMDMLHKKNSQKMQEAIISSLIYVDKENHRFHQFLAKWAPKKVSPEFELIFKDYVRSKPVYGWKKTLSWSIY